MADAIISPFVMHSARDAMASGLPHIEEQVKGIEQAVVGNSGLHRVHRQDRPPAPPPGSTFDDNVAFNDHVDESFGSFTVFGVLFRPSKVLFKMEHESYCIYLAEFDDGDSEAMAADDKEGAPP